MIWGVSYTLAQWEAATTSVAWAYQHQLQVDPLMRFRMAQAVPDAARVAPHGDQSHHYAAAGCAADIHEDLISNSRMSTDQTMFKLYTIFQPVTQTERTSLLLLLLLVRLEATFSQRD